MRNVDWQEDRNAIETTTRVTQQEAFFASNPAATTLVTDFRFPASEGPLVNGPYLRIGLLTGSHARLVLQSDVTRYDTVWRPGAIAVTLPGMRGEFASSPVSVIGLAIDLSRISYCEECNLCVEDLVEASLSPHQDALIASTMVALRHYAQVHACSSAFFDHGVMVVLDRLRGLRRADSARPKTRALDGARLSRVMSLIESRLSGDVSVSEMAGETRQDASGFSRAFKAATGLTPYAYLTRARMDRAVRLLDAGLSVTHAALAVGYTNPSKFAAAFRRVRGVNPTEWLARRG